MSAKMAVRVEMRPRSTIDEFAVKHGLVMVVSERSPELGFPEGHSSHWYAHFERAEVKEGGCLRSNYGNGRTHAEAIEAYGPEISEKLLVIDAYLDTRREIRVPIIVPMPTSDSISTKSAISQLSEQAEKP